MTNDLQLPEHLEDFGAFLLEFNKETERGSALLAASMLDEMLGKVLAAFLVPGKAAEALMDGFNAPFGTFSSKIAACAALGLISEEERAEIDRIRKVRNEFGHGLGVTFNTPKVKGQCDNLTMTVKDYVLPDGTKLGPFDARAKFTSAAVAVIVRLINRAHYVGQKRLSYQPWTY